MASRRSKSAREPRPRVGRQPAGRRRPGAMNRRLPPNQHLAAAQRQPRLSQSGHSGPRPRTGRSQGRARRPASAAARRSPIPRSARAPPPAAAGAHTGDTTRAGPGRAEPNSGLRTAAMHLGARVRAAARARRGRPRMARSGPRCAIRRRWGRRRSVLFARADQLFRHLRAARLDNSVEAEMRRLARVDLLILDDFALHPMDQVQTADFYELVGERHQRTATILTSNRDPSEWIGLDERPAARPIRRRPTRGHQLRARHRRTVLPPPTTTHTRRRRRRVLIDPPGRTDEHHPTTLVVPRSWQLGGPIPLASDTKAHEAMPAGVRASSTRRRR
jgi:IstB-like ATP binding protein